MAFIAEYWWVWLIGLLVCGGFGLYRWFMSFFKTAGTMVKAATFTLEGVQVASDKEKTTKEKAKHAQDRFLEEVTKEGRSRIWDFGTAGAAIIAANVFGVLLVISILVSLIDYFKGG